MSITFSCPCGRTLTAADDQAGQRVQCPECARSPVAPAGGARPWERRGAEPTDPDNPFGFTSPSDTARDRDRQARERESGDGKGRSLEGGILNGGVAGGMLAMFIAVVWFVVGLAADIIFFYPPILFVIGLVAFFKGLAQGSGR